VPSGNRPNNGAYPQHKMTKYCHTTYEGLPPQPTVYPLHPTPTTERKREAGKRKVSEGSPYASSQVRPPSALQALPSRADENYHDNDPNPHTEPNPTKKTQHQTPHSGNTHPHKKQPTPQPTNAQKQTLFYTPFFTLFSPSG